MAQNKENEFIKILEGIDDLVERQGDRITSVEEKIFKTIRRYLEKNLETDRAGNIRRTVKNLRVIRDIMKIRKVMVGGNYEDVIKEFVRNFDLVAEKTNKYFE